MAGSSPSDKSNSASTEPSEEVPSMTLLQTTQSVLWAMLGVQSKKNARRDFSKGKFSHFVIIGVVFALVFIFTLVSIIRVVIPDSIS